VIRLLHSCLESTGVQQVTQSRDLFLFRLRHFLSPMRVSTETLVLISGIVRQACPPKSCFITLYSLSFLEYPVSDMTSCVVEMFRSSIGNTERLR